MKFRFFITLALILLSVSACVVAPGSGGHRGSGGGSGWGGGGWGGHEGGRDAGRRVWR